MNRQLFRKIGKSQNHHRNQRYNTNPDQPKLPITEEMRYKS